MEGAFRDRGTWARGASEADGTERKPAPMRWDPPCLAVGGGVLLKTQVPVPAASAGRPGRPHIRAPGPCAGRGVTFHLVVQAAVSLWSREENGCVLSSGKVLQAVGAAPVALVPALVSWKSISHADPEPCLIRVGNPCAGGGDGCGVQPATWGSCHRAGGTLVRSEEAAAQAMEDGH